MNLPDKLKKTVKVQITENKVLIALNQLLEHTQYESTIVQLKNRFSVIEQQKNSGTLDNQQYSLESNKIIEAILAFVDQDDEAPETKKNSPSKNPSQGGEQSSSTFNFNNNMKNNKGNIYQGENTIYRDRRKK